MSQAKNTLKKIASSEEYRNLEAAIKELNAQAIFSSYVSISGLLEEAEKEILENIQKLPRRNKDLDLQQFRSAFAARTLTMLPGWHWVDAELKRQKIMEGKVFGLGTKGDPLVKTQEGKVVVVSGATLKEGDKVRFKVITEGPKISFGRVVELTPETFYLILTEDIREGIRNSLSTLGERINTHAQSTAENKLAELSQLLQELEGVRENAAKLGETERAAITSRVQFYRNRLLKTSLGKFVLDFLTRREEKEITDYCQGDQQQIAKALSSPGLFRYQAHVSVKAALLAGDKPKGYGETVNELEKNLNSMDAALQLMDFKAKIDGIYPMAKSYLERIDRLFGRISVKAEQLVASLAEGKAHDASEIQAAIEEAFSPAALATEIRGVFRSLGEFFELREALTEMRGMLGDAESKSNEAILEPYLRGIVASAFEANAVKKN